MKPILFFLLSAAGLSAADLKAGLGRIDITPQAPIWMSGYAARSKPSQGVLQRLWAKALAVEDHKKSRVVIVTTDIIGLPRAVSDEVGARVEKQYGLPRSRLMLNSSHTHTGPVVWPNLASMYTFTPEQEQVVKEYGRKLVDDLVSVVGAALSDLAPARLSYGSGSAGFAANRRSRGQQGVAIGVNPSGPVDHSVPVVKVEAPDGRLRGVLFAYTCHNTTLTAEFYQLSGDYAGFAQAEIEQAHPGATALFMILCGADQNPNPRSKLELAQQHGRSLAAEVLRVLGARMVPIEPPVRASFRLIELAFAPHSREQFEKEAQESNVFKVARAKAMLAAYDQRRPVRSAPYPIQAFRFGKGLTLVALGGEVVVDYALRIKREFGEDNMVVAGYSNDVMCYIPSRRVLKEGGYEAESSMIYYGQPGPFSEEVEDTVMAGVEKTLKAVGRARAR